MVMPTQTHEVKLKRIIGYLSQARKRCIKYGSQSPTNRVIAHSAPSGTPSGCIFIRLDYRLRNENETPLGPSRGRPSGAIATRTVRCAASQKEAVDEHAIEERPLCSC